MFLSQDFGDKINVIRDDHYGKVGSANIFKDRKKVIFILRLEFLHLY